MALVFFQHFDEYDISDFWLKQRNNYGGNWKRTVRVYNHYKTQYTAILEHNQDIKHVEWATTCIFLWMEECCLLEEKTHGFPFSNLHKFQKLIFLSCSSRVFSKYSNRVSCIFYGVLRVKFVKYRKSIIFNQDFSLFGVNWQQNE